MWDYCKIHPLCQFGGVNPHWLQKLLFVVFPQERFGFFFQIVFIDDWHERIGQRAFLTVTAVIYLSLIHIWGIACGLNNLQKISDGEPLGGKSRAEDDFSTEDDDDYLS